MNAGKKKPGRKLLFRHPTPICMIYGGISFLFKIEEEKLYECLITAQIFLLLFQIITLLPGN